MEEPQGIGEEEELDPIIYFLPYNVPSSKNGKTLGKFRSKTVNKYLQKLGVADYSVTKSTYKNYKSKDRPNQFEAFVQSLPVIEAYPIILGMHFVRDSRRAYDFNNISQIIQDLLTAHGYLEDDDVSHVLPIPMTKEGILLDSQTIRTADFSSVDKENPGVFIRIC